MRGMFNRDGRTMFNSMVERIGLANNAAFAEFDFRAAAAAGPPLPAGLIILTPDEAGDGIGLAPGNPTLAIDAASTIGTIGTIGDQDFYQVTLVAGHVYEIGMFGHFGGPNLLPVQDSYIELYAANGSLVGSADGGASTVINNVNSGFDAVLTFTAAASGTYYVNARAFDNDPNVGGATGEGVGDYEVYVKEVDPNDPGIYHPYYDASSPLYAIDWGTQVNRINQTARNPDGNEGMRGTGNAQGTPILDDPGLIATLAAAQGKDIGGKNVITIYIAKAGDIFTSLQDPTSPGLPPILVSLGTQQFEKDTVWTALHEFEKVADVVYIEVPTREQADFFFTTYAGTPGPGVSLLGSMSPPDYPDEGLAQFNSADYRWTAENLQQGGFSYVTLIHEFGHGHGLAHPHDNGGHSGILNGVESEGVVADYTLGDFELNQAIYTMMSYEDGWQSSPYGNADTDVGYGYLGGLMAFDIAAIQDKYGVNEDWATGNDIYVLKDENAAGTFYSSIWDGGGTDSIVYSGARDAHIDLRAASLQYEYGGGGWVSYAYGIYGGFTVANGVTIENATGGSGNDILIGNHVANILIGGGGVDTLAGGAGNDIYRVEEAGDSVVEAAGGGADSVYAVASYALAAGSEVELLSAIDPGAAVAMDLTGNEFANMLIGTNGANVLIGGGGADRLVGGAGNDVYRVEEAGDTAVEAAGGGADSVYAVASYALAAGSEVELLSAIDPGAAVAMELTGNEFANTLIGTNGANVLIGGGGNDVLAGLAGNDVYRVENAGDVVLEAAGAGLDAVYVALSGYTLNAGAEIELVSAIDPAATAAFDLTGNEFGNTLIGTAGANVLIGGGGNDVLAGGLGNDVYRVEDAGDLVLEGAGGGADSVYATASYALNAGAEVELLSAIDPGSAGAMDLTGNEFANTIIGNAGANVLIGGGGNDVLAGGGGNDLYRVEDAGDVVIEGVGGGFDAIYATTSYALQAGSEVELLSAIDPASTGALNLSGNELGQTIIGTAGANVLTGGGGADSFAFLAAPGGGNVDTIADFASGVDRILLDDAGFAGLGPGGLPAGAFVTGTAAQDVDDRIIYNQANGQLLFDADGSGAGAAILFATIQGAPTLGAGDFQVI